MVISTGMSSSRSALTAGPSFEELRNRELHRETVFARRAHKPRRHKVVKSSTRAFVSVLTRHFLRSSDLPVELLDFFFCKSKAANTFDAYVAEARSESWFAHAVAQRFPAIPADQLWLTCWLATVGYRDSCYKPTKSRCCTIDALHTLVGLTLPGADPRIQTLRALFRRTKTFLQGRARPVLQAEIPIVGPDPATSPLRGGEPGRALRSLPVLGSIPPDASPSQGRHRRAHGRLARRHAAARRHPRGSSGRHSRSTPTSTSLGDIWFRAEAVDEGIFGPKTNQLLEGQSAQMPPEEATTPLLASGARALLEITRRCLARLVALPTPVFAAVARRLAERFPRDASTPGAMATGQDNVRTLAVPLFERGLLSTACRTTALGCGSPRTQPLTAESDLSATGTLPTRALSRCHGKRLPRQARPPPA